ncbi:NAD(P)-dependent oxidoreductase [Stappia sp. WLB 29]|uniref:NAD(P)-dependent oxidoreductase n=1 Tax=Stappia sp. WLB 29 TaxID=2925220 RepID=UPI0020C185C4|nr:NAD(P)-dependent oxidoreductase [Stappia sp. WLB 29]
MRRLCKPSEGQEGVRAPRVGKLACLPVFLPLAGRPVLVAGGSDAAAWKAELLAATGAEVHVCSPEPGDAMRALLEDADATVDGRLVHHARAWSPHSLAGMAVALADAEDEREAERFAAAAKAAGVPCNVIDRPVFCDFQFGSIVNRSPVVVGISTSGAAPILGQAIRQRIETLLPNALADWAALAARIRSGVMARLPAGRRRRLFWEDFAGQAFSGRPPENMAGGLDKLLGRLAVDADGDTGSVTLVATGPGPAEHLTMKAIRTLQGADVVLYGEGVSGEVLDLARREARRMLVSGVSGEAAGPEGAALAAQLAAQGRQVVRLVPGDGNSPEVAVFRNAMRRSGVAIRLVPGVTSSIACGESDATQAVGYPLSL